MGVAYVLWFVPRVQLRSSAWAFDFAEYEKKIEYDNYIAIYTYPNRIKKKEEILAIKALAKEYNCKLLGVGFYFPWCDITAIPHPFEVLSIIKNARTIALAHLPRHVLSEENITASGFNINVEACKLQHRYEEMV